MARMGGFPGGGNMQNLIRQAQKMQQQMQEAQEQLAESEVTATAGGGMVEMVMDGSKKLVSITIKPEVVDADDVATLEDLIMACYNDAIDKVDELTKEIMGPFAQMGGGMF